MQHLHRGKTRLHRQGSPRKTAQNKVAVEDAGVVEGPGKNSVISRVIDLPPITRPPRSDRLLTKTKADKRRRSRSVLTG